RLTAVFVGDLGAQLDFLVSAVESVQHGGVFFGDETATDPAGAGDLVVVGVEFLVQHQAAPDARRFRQPGIASADLVPDQPERFRTSAEILEGGVGDVVALSPFAYRRRVD